MRQLLTHFAFALSIAAPAAVTAQTGVNDDRVSLPEGPGSLEGIGDNATVNPNQGSMTFSVPIDVPEGFAGVTPSLALDYSSAAGVGLSGIGWDLGVPYIERMTNLRLPDYDVDDDFAANGGLQLVRVAAEPDVFEYRARFEKGFSRYRWYGAGEGTAGYWTEETPEGITRFYGADPEGAAVDDARAFGRDNAVFRWHLVAAVDPFGHRARYDYTLRGGLPHLERVQYIFTDGPPGAAIELAYEARDDLISDARSGRNEVRTHRLSTVDVLSKGTRIWRYQLSYEPYETSGGFSRLSRVERFGVGNEPYPIVFDFEYSRTLGGVCEVGCEAPYLVDMGSVGVNLASGEATLVDLNGDALPDIVDSAQPGGHRIFLNRFEGRGAQRFEAQDRSAAGTQASHQISSPYVQTLDANGDGRADLANVQTGDVLFNLGRGDWAPVEAMRQADALPDFGEDFAVGAEELTHVRFFDFDNDRRIDVLRCTDVSTDIYRNLGPEGFALAEGVEPIGVGFADSRLELADMNGDGLLDAVVIRAGGVRYRINLGLGRWSGWRDIDELPFDDAQLDFVELEDINGDSLDDIVVVQADQLSYALNRGGDRFDAPVAVREAGGRALPHRVDGTTVLFADMNGSGSDDVVWINAEGDVTYLELFPLRPNLLTRITNGLGLVTDVTYTTSVEQLAEADAPWAYKLPFPMLMVGSIDTYDAFNDVHSVARYAYADAYYDEVDKALRGFEQVEVLREGDDSQESALERLRYELGQEDPYRAGLLAEADTFTLAEGEVTPLQAVRNTYEDCPLRGVDEAEGPWPVRFVCRTETETVLQEGAEPEAWVTLQERLSYDGFGNVTETAALGVVEGAVCGACERPEGLYGAPCGPECLGDELYTRTTFAEPSPEGRWMLRLPVWERVAAEAEAEVHTEQLTYYDGEPFAGLPLGQHTHGRPTRVTQRVDADHVITLARSRYDEHGNVVESIGPRGQLGQAGFRTFTSYDAEQLLIERVETELLDPEGEPYRLRRSYTYDPLWGQVTSATGWVTLRDGEALTTSATQRFAYDAVGRLAAIAHPGDELERPTTEWLYEPGTPVSRVVVRQRSEVGARLPDIESVQCFDGFGRRYQTRHRLANALYEVDGFSVRNRQGTVVRQHRPYRGEDERCALEAPDGLPVVSWNDARGRPLLEEFPDEGIYGTPSTTRKVYRPLVTVEHDVEDTDPESPRFETPTLRSYDGQNRLVSVEYRGARDLPGATWRLMYDVYGNFAGLVDPEGNLRTQRYDGARRVVEVDDPNHGVHRFELDDDGNRVRSEDDAGRVVLAAYDALSRLAARWDEADPEGTRIETLYDDPALCPDAGCDYTGRMPVLTRFPRGASWSTYDLRQRAVTETVELDGLRLTTGYRYDNLDRRVTALLPDGTALEYQVDGVGRVVGVPGFVDEVVYDRASLLERLTLANGVVERWGYDVLERPVTIDIGPPEGSLVDLSYAHTRAGLTTEVADGAAPEAAPSQSALYTYDGLGRLIRAQLDARRPLFAETVDYAYDAIDNLVRRTSSRGAASPAHIGEMSYGEGAGPNALTRAGAMELEYDGAGFLTRRGDLSFSWDVFGRLTQAHRDDAEILRAAPGAGADRHVVEEGPGFNLLLSPVFEVEDGMALTHVYLGDRLVATRESDTLAARVLSDLAPAQGEAVLDPEPDGRIDSGDAIVAERAHGGVGLLGEVEPSATRRLLRASVRRSLLEGEPRRTFHHRDRDGNTVAVTDGEGAVVDRVAWYPFGLARTPAGSGRWGRGSKQTDSSTQLTFYGARYYDPTLGRWLSPDPAFTVLTEDFGANRPREATGAYLYCFNNPVTFEDMDGGHGWAKSAASWVSRNVLRRRAPAATSESSRPVDLGVGFSGMSAAISQYRRAQKAADAIASQKFDLNLERAQAVADTGSSDNLTVRGFDRQLARLDVKLETAQLVASVAGQNLDALQPAPEPAKAPAAAADSPLASKARGSGRKVASRKYKVRRKKRVSKKRIRNQVARADRLGKGGKKGRK